MKLPLTIAAIATFSLQLGTAMAAGPATTPPMETAYATDPAKRAEAEAMYRAARDNVLGGFQAESADESERKMLEAAYLGFPHAVFQQCMTESDDYGRDPRGDLPLGLAWCRISAQLAPGEYGGFAEKKARKLGRKLGPEQLERADAEQERIRSEMQTRRAAGEG